MGDTPEKFIIPILVLPGILRIEAIRADRVLRNPESTEEERRNAQAFLDEVGIDTLFKNAGDNDPIGS